jgi:hypothetical protein
MRSRKHHWFELSHDAKRFINTCIICGRQGYAPQIDDADFVSESMMFHGLVREILQSQLREYFNLLPLDEAGRCEGCSANANSN